MQQTPGAARYQVAKKAAAQTAGGPAARESTAAASDCRRCPTCAYQSCRVAAEPRRFGGDRVRHSKNVQDVPSQVPHCSVRQHDCESSRMAKGCEVSVVPVNGTQRTLAKASRCLCG